MSNTDTEKRNEIGNIFARIHESEMELKKIQSELAGYYAELASVFQQKAPDWLWNTLTKIPHREIPHMFDGKNFFLKNLFYYTQNRKGLVINFGVWVDTTPVGKEFAIPRNSHIPDNVNKQLQELFVEFKITAVFWTDREGYLSLIVN